jgi:predicted DCC family thiol-disulfide oxidoreductase YuxK
VSVLSIVVLLTVVASLLTLAGRHRAIVLASIRRFFTEPGSPFNLAVARIVFFAVVLWEISAVGLRDVQDYSRLPAGLITPPHDLGGLLAALPINPTCVTVAWAALVTAGVLGLVGVFPRLSALVVVIAGFYYLGVPQLYGYVKHDQHIIWIGAILAVSPSADALSLQAVWRAWRRPSTHVNGGPPRSVQYALPLRFIWLAMGVLYLSAGLAKYRFDGLRWLEPSTLRYWMHELWLQNGNYRPPLIHRPDEFGPLLTFGAAYTLVFELTFLLWLFSRLARPFLALAGLVFHNATNFFLNIPFWSLQAFYITLFDWDRISRLAFGRRSGMRLIYDDSCASCMKAVGTLQALTLPGSVTFVKNAPGHVALAAHQRHPPGAWVPAREVHLVAGDQTFVGYAAYRRLARRVPALWPLAALLHLPMLGAFGERVYRRAAVHHTLKEHHAAPPRTRGATKPVIAVGAALLLWLFAVILPGLRSASASRASVDGWPFASYPSFAGTPTATADELSVLALSPTGEPRRVNLRRRLPFIPPDRLAGLTTTILDERDARRRAAELADLVCAAGVPPGSRQVVVYDQKVMLDPDRAGRVVSSKELSKMSVSVSARGRFGLNCQHGA